MGNKIGEFLYTAYRKTSILDDNGDILTGRLKKYKTLYSEVVYVTKSKKHKNCVVFVLVNGDKRYSFDSSLKQLLLNSNLFCMIQRNLVVNIDYINSTNSKLGSIELDGVGSYKVNKTYRQKLQRKLEEKYMF
ncbi:LytTR family transcriptional regulator DNA-binding domain-containing protein [Pontimicrobium sp. MEBiC01747]